MSEPKHENSLQTGVRWAGNAAWAGYYGWLAYKLWGKLTAKGPSLYDLPDVHDLVKANREVMARIMPRFDAAKKSIQELVGSSKAEFQMQAMESEEGKYYRDEIEAVIEDMKNLQMPTKAQVAKCLRMTKWADKLEVAFLAYRKAQHEQIFGGNVCEENRDRLKKYAKANGYSVPKVYDRLSEPEMPFNPELERLWSPRHLRLLRDAELDKKLEEANHIGPWGALFITAWLIFVLYVYTKGFAF